MISLTLIKGAKDMMATLGISDARREEFIVRTGNACKDIVMRAVKAAETDPEAGLNDGDLVIELLEAISPETPEELCAVSYILLGIIDKTIETVQKITMLQDIHKEFGEASNTSDPADDLFKL